MLKKLAIALSLSTVFALALSGCSSAGHSMNMSGIDLSDTVDDFAEVATGTTRTYFIEAVQIDWQYAPENKNLITGQPFSQDEALFAEKGPWGTGKTYKKCVYQRFSDASFTEQIKNPAYMGVLGPTIYAEVGDKVNLVFKNTCSFGNTVHVHGLEYDKRSEGATYQDGTTFKSDDDVNPGNTYTYHYKVPESAGPAYMDGSTAMWMYHSHNDEVQDVYAGLTGFIVVTKHGMANADGTPNDVDQMVFSLFEIFDENQSRLSDINFSSIVSRTRESEDFIESNLKHSINGFIYGNGPMPVLKAGTRVRWFLMDMGNEVDEHTPHWHGNTAVVNGMRTDVVSMLPGMMITAEMKPTNRGIWLFHCHVADHLTAGMVGRYEVK